MLTLTPQARAIAALVLGFLTLTGETVRLAAAVIFALGDAYPHDTLGQFLASLIPVAIVFAAWFLAAPVANGTSGWETHVASAARLIVGLGIILTTLISLGILVNQGGGGFANPFAGI